MGRSTEDAETLFEDMDGPYLVRLGNWLASSLDVSELDKEEILLLQMILERGLSVLWETFPEVFTSLMMRAILMQDPDEDD